MRKILVLLLFILFLILAWFSWCWYKETVVCCPEPLPEISYGPLIFDCNSAEVITNDLWPEKKQEILHNGTKGKKLLLVGPYFTAESEQDGINRAEKVKLLFSELPSEEVIIDARFAGDCEDTKLNMLHELKYKWVTRNDDIIEHLDRTFVFYKYDSDKEVTNEAVVAYFNELSSFLIESGDKILIVGHTDSDGPSLYNEDLGLKRAIEYKTHLTSLGVEESKVTVESKGETEPLRPNDTPENKQMNRRVAIHIME
ncbi:OmpA family protein [Aestuariibaculum suncheonense]|uniref:OmpA family protein n=1 Tax=Aestuariibaculum suncheonense TaxID=1028745 RepID=A0A8J6QVX6_9FLAO|nr:OmpA family protein [Aestuariibaculum suncheonense]MBD0835989.1 OmpA family protein [Aestuariibaculum suncheonense]